MNTESTIKNDWRYQNQDSYLKGLKFVLVDYTSRSKNDHDHCEFCGEKLSAVIPNALNKGWTDDSSYRWICNECFEDFEQVLKLERNEKLE